MASIRSWWFPFIGIFMLVGCEPKVQADSSTTASMRISQVENIEAYLVQNIGFSSQGDRCSAPVRP
jgi:hypothetical protein